MTLYAMTVGSMTNLKLNVKLAVIKNLLTVDAVDLYYQVQLSL